MTLGFVWESFTDQNYSLRKSQPWLLDHGLGVRNKGILDEARGPRGSGNSSGLYNVAEGLGK